MVDKERKPLKEGVEKGMKKPGPKRPEPEVTPPPQKPKTIEPQEEKG